MKDYNTFTYDEILKDLDKTEEWLHVIGLKIENNRLGKARKNFGLINKLYRQNNVEMIDKKVGDDSAIESMFTCMGFNDIYKTLSKFGNRKDFRQILKDSLKGKLKSIDEIGRSRDHARNIFFQLELASFLRNHGINIVGFDDIEFNFDGYNFIVECKRPFLEKNIPSNINKAFSQLREKLKENEKGIIAIGLDKCVGKQRDIEGKIFNCKNFQDVIKEENQIIDDFISKYGSCWKNRMDINIVGVFLYIKLIFIVKDNAVSVRKGLHLIPRHPRLSEYPSLDRFLFEDLYRETL